jgi:predicted aspartyl protease
MANLAKHNSIQRWCFVFAASLSLWFPAIRAQAACKLGKVAELKVTMDGMRPVVEARINGHDGKLIVDSGSYYNVISGPGAIQSGLKLKPPPSFLAAKGPDGKPLLSIGVADSFQVGDLRVQDVEFLAGGNYSGPEGLIGQTFFQTDDVEYDLANGVIRLMRPDGCSDAGLAYWTGGKQTYSIVDISPTTPAQPFVAGMALLNGVQVHVLFDTGATASRISPQAAKRAGLKADPSELTDAGYSTGIGRPRVMTHLAPFATLKLGDEEIRNLHLRIGDTRDGTDLLLGADFFVSHRIYVSNAQHKLYFTYNGGQVFSASR